VVGDRWTLLIVRELLLRGPARYSDLQHGLPGIATNLLASRLRELERSGVVSREEATPPVATALFRLTPRGEALEPIVLQLGRWGAPFLAQAPQSDAFRSHWLALPLGHLLQDHTPDRPGITIELRTGDQPLTLDVGAGAVHVRPGAASRPDAVLSGPPRPLLAVLTGKLSLAAAEGAGVRYDGDRALLLRVQPGPEGLAEGSRRGSGATARRRSPRGTRRRRS